MNTSDCREFMAKNIKTAIESQLASTTKKAGKQELIDLLVDLVMNDVLHNASP